MILKIEDGGGNNISLNNSPSITFKTGGKGKITFLS